MSDSTPRVGPIVLYAGAWLQCAVLSAVFDYGADPVDGAMRLTPSVLACEYAIRWMLMTPIMRLTCQRLTLWWRHQREAHCDRLMRQHYARRMVELDSSTDSIYRRPDNVTLH